MDIHVGDYVRVYALTYGQHNGWKKVINVDQAFISLDDGSTTFPSMIIEKANNFKKVILDVQGSVAESGLLHRS